MKRLEIRRRVRAAQIAYEQGRIEGEIERQDREDAERAAEGAAWLKTQIDRNPQGVWFPADSEPNWLQSFWAHGRDR